jgi:hypothetical protein
MAWFKKRNVDNTQTIPLNRLATPSQISSYIKKLISASQYEFHESEALEVKEVIRNKTGDRDSIRGVFLNSGEDPGVIKSLMPNIVNVPVIGEHVVCVEYNGQYYYTSVINRKGSINENSIPGVVGGYDSSKKYGKSFERKNVKQIRVNEGSIVFEGRYGQSIHLDKAGNHTPQILMRAHKTFEDTNNEPFIKENIDNDDASLYLISDGLSTIKFDGQQISGKKVLIKSNGIFISGDDVRLGSSVEADIQPVVLGNALKELLDNVFEGEIVKNNTTITKNTATIASLTSIQPMTPQQVDEVETLIEENKNLVELNIKLQTSITKSTYLSSKVKTA